MRNDPAYENSGRDFERYLDYMHGQIRELCTNYGKLDLLWFDFGYDHLRGEAWRGNALADMVRTLQPEVLLDNRIEVSGEGFGSLYQCDPKPYHGDFVTPEKFIPPQGIRDIQGRPMVWESCVTMNNNWGYCPQDHNYKSAGLLIKKLVECVSKGGNMILNVGPDGDGNFPTESMEILAQIGAWMDKNRESICGCGPAELEKPEYGRLTQNGRKLYVHIFENTLGPLPILGLQKEQVESLRLLDGGKSIPISTSWVHSDYPEILFADLGTDPMLPDPVDTVLEVSLKG
jgi:alpha-L-fucosidase